MTGFGDPRQAAQQGHAIAGFAIGPMPFGLDKHLASLPVIGRLEGESSHSPF